MRAGVLLPQRDGASGGDGHIPHPLPGSARCCTTSTTHTSCSGLDHRRGHHPSRPQWGQRTAPVHRHRHPRTRRTPLRRRHPGDERTGSESTGCSAACSFPPGRSSMLKWSDKVGRQHSTSHPTVSTPHCSPASKPKPRAQDEADGATTVPVPQHLSHPRRLLPNQMGTVTRRMSVSVCQSFPTLIASEGPVMAPTTLEESPSLVQMSTAWTATTTGSDARTPSSERLLRT
jgi:hypothetical protein